MLQIQQASLGTVLWKGLRLGFAGPFRIRTSFAGLFYHTVQEQGQGLWQGLVLGSSFVCGLYFFTSLSQYHVDAEVSSGGTTWRDLGNQIPHLYIREISSREFHMGSQMFLGQILKGPPFGNFLSAYVSIFSCMLYFVYHFSAWRFDSNQ